MLATQGLSSLCAQTAAQIVANNGDPIKAIKALASMNTVKSIAMNMASTLIMNNLCEGLKIKELAKRELVDHIQYHIARASVSTTLNMSIGGKETEKSLTDGLIDAAIGIALAPINVKIDSWHDLGETSMFTHTAIKAAIGAGVGALRNDGALAGMLEYMTTAIVEEMFPAKKEIKKEVAEQEKGFKEKRKDKEESEPSEFSTNQEFKSDNLSVKPLIKNQDKEQILAYQKQLLAAQIINNLNLQIYLQANLQGVNFDINQMAEIIINKIDAMDIKDLSKLERAFNFYSFQPTEIRQFKVVNAIFENAASPEEPTTTTDSTKSFWQRFKENYVKFSTEQDEVDIAINRAQSETTLRLLERYQKRISSAYTNWSDQKDKRLETLQEWYDAEALDVEAYVYKQQSEFLMKHTTIAKSRENFELVKVVNENSISLKLDPTEKSITKAVDILKLGNEKINVGLTTFNKTITDIIPMELSSSSGSNSKAGISNHVGINVVQIKSKLFNFDLNVLTCNSNFAVNKLFSSLSPTAKLHCSLVDAIVTTPKKEILCAFSKCVEIEARGGWKVGTLRISRDKTKQPKIDADLGVSIKGQLDIKIIDKSKKKP